MVLPNFIVFEGIDGSGTSTQLAMLQKYLLAAKTFFTAEPTNLETGLFLRRILRGEISVHPHTAAWLFAADRSEHLYGTGGIIEHCNSGHFCVCDRYIFSSLAYQSIECGEELPARLNETFPLPSIVFYFNIDPDISLQRIQDRSASEIYENKDFLTKVLHQYKKVFNSYIQTCTNQKDSMKIFNIDAAAPAEDIAAFIWSEIKKLPILNM